MSTDHQRYSYVNQAAGIAAYAAERGFEIVRTYKDAGKSGLQLKSRTGLQALLADALRRDRGYDAVLVLDVSRWGRFQDLDQAAHYEFLCRQAGLSVIYCAEPFDNDGSASAALLKGLKRLMAAEYSRELSAKTKAAHLLQARLGFRQGAPLAYGVQRVLVDANRRPRSDIPRGVWKARQDDHIALRAGPEHEVQIVRRIFRRFVLDRRNGRCIAEELNGAGVPFIGDRPWNREAVLRLLENELMVGVYIYNRRSRPLKGEFIHNPPEIWVRVQVFEPIVEPRLFEQAQARLAAMRHVATPEELLQGLQKLLLRHGRITAALIDAGDDLPSRATYQRCFGTLTKAYAAVGYKHQPRRTS